MSGGAPIEIEIEGAGKDYAGHWAIRHLMCSIAGGEIFALLGPNGAGKTTTIRMLTGLVRPTEGLIRICGHDMVHEPIKAKSLMGYVPDKSYLYEKLTGREFLRFTGSLHGLRVSNERVEELTELLGIPDAVDELIEGYSHGMRQRLLFSSAILHEPRVLVIDEPFVGLDPYGVRGVTALLRRLAGQGTAILLATHSLHIAQDLCHRVGIVHRGRLAALIGREGFGQGAGALEELFITITSSPPGPITSSPPEEGRP